MVPSGDALFVALRPVASATKSRSGPFGAAEIMNDALEGGESAVDLPPPLITCATAAHRPFTCSDIDGDGDKRGATARTCSSSGNRHQSFHFHSADHSPSDFWPHSEVNLTE